ncbi:ABC transporter substrate-binding protein [Marivita sp.]|uniref:ABC transporter substrate-binding protein n=1 Tax=Marivita sp. TaxID=2003365 RepID=UPI003B520C43
MRKLLSLTAFALSFAGPALAEDIPIKFTLDWKIQGVHGWFYLAEEKGYFDAEGLDVTIDQGEGSAATVSRIISGAYDAGFGDMNAIIQNAATNPDEAPVMVYQIEVPRVYRRVFYSKPMRRYQGRSCLHRMRPPFPVAADGRLRHVAARCCTN